MVRISKERKSHMIGGCLVMILLFLSVLGASVSEIENIEKQHEIELLKLEVELLNKNKEIIELKSFQDSVKMYELSWENIDMWLDGFNIEHKEIVKHQIFLETGNLSSDICSINKNLCGMRRPRVRETTAIGERKAFAVYETYFDSVKDYALWQDSMYSGEDCYYTFLDDVGYCTGNTYIGKLKYIDRNVTI